MTRVPTLAIVMVGMMLFAGATVGVEQAADGGERINLTERLADDVFHENGTVNTTPSDAQPAPFETGLNGTAKPVFADRPGADKWLRQHVAAPMIRASIWFAGFGFALGYGMASTIGAAASRLVLNGAVVAAVVGVGWRVYRLLREVAR